MIRMILLRIPVFRTYLARQAAQRRKARFDAIMVETSMIMKGL